MITYTDRQHNRSLRYSIAIYLIPVIALLGFASAGCCAYALTAPTLTIATSSSPSVYGASVTFTAILSVSVSSPEVTFYDGGTSLGSIAISGTTATFTTSALTVGTHSITASWAGNTSYSAVTSSPITQTVKNASTTALSVSSSSVLVGTAVTLTATVKNGTTAISPGLVFFCNASAAHCEDMAVLGTAQLTSAGIATIVLRLGVGTHNINAVFVGTSGYRSSTSGMQTVIVNSSSGAYPSSTTLAASGNASNYTLSGSVVGGGLAAPIGSVTFLDTSNGNAQIGSETLGAPGYVLQGPTFYGDNNALCYDTECIAITTDIDGDGIPDVVNTNYSNNTVSISIGNGDGSFKTPVSYATGTTPGFIAVGDFNADGAPDLVVSNSGSNTVGVFLSNGDGTFQPQVTYGAGTDPEGVAVGDFNSDGIADILVVNGSNTISVLFGNGNGTFQAQISTSTVKNTPSAVAVADFNGDGILDVAVALNNGSSANSEIAVFLGKGNGTFQAPVMYSPAGAISLTVTDFNQDGIPDLAYATHGSNTVSVMIGNGDGTFRPTVLYAAGSNVGAVATADFNQDGIPDIVVTGSPTDVLLGNGNGTFQPPISYAAPAGGVAVADLNGDGLPDVVDLGGQLAVLLDANVINYSESGISFTGSIGQHNVVASYPGNSSYIASMSAPVTLYSSNSSPVLTFTPIATQTYGAAPFTVSANSASTGTITYSVTSGPATISGSTLTISGVGTVVVRASQAATATYNPATASINITVNPVTPTLTVTTSGTPSTSGGSVTFTAAISNGLTGAVTFYDKGASIGTSVISGNTATLTTSTLAVGLHTITASWAGNANYAAVISSAITQAVNNSAETTTLSVSSSSVSVGTAVTLTATVKNGATAISPGLVRFCNASAAECEDMAVLGTAQLTSAGTAAIALRLGVGTHSINAVFTGTSAYPASTSGVKTVVVNSSPGTYPSITTLAASGNPGNYTLSGTVAGYGTSAPVGSVALLDTTNSNASLGSVMLGASAYTLQGPTMYADNNAYCYDTACIAITADVDGDGIPDVVNTNYGNNTVSISIGNGDGSFKAPVSYPTGTTPGYIATGDFNADGVPDLVVSNSGSSTVGVFLGNGNGTFQAQVAYTLGSNPAGVAVGDFNGDGIADILVVNQVNTISVLLGNGNGTFQTPVNTRTASYTPEAVAVADFNGDGMLDVAVAINNGGSATSEIAVFLGNGDGTFQTPVMYSPAGAVALTVTDFNQDGIPDLAYATHGSNTVSVMIGNGDGTFQPTVLYTAGSNVGAVATADFNQDGIPDILVTGSPTDVLLGNGNGTFQAPISYNASAGGVAVADLNGDGLPDVVDLGGQLGVLLDAHVSSYTESGVSFTGSIGLHNVVASYPGSSSYAASISTPVGLYSSNDTPTLSVVSFATPTVYGSSVTFTATISSGPTGTITFYDGTSSIGTGTLIGQTATFTTNALAAGTHVITAGWAGNSTYSAVISSAITQVVNPATPTLTVASSVTSSSYGAPVILTATISSGINGSVTFNDGGTSIGTGTISGTTATLSTSTLAVGTHTITASWAGNTDYSAITSGSITQTVSQANTITQLSSTSDPSAFNQNVVFQAILTTAGGAPTGTVTFSDNGTTIGTSTVTTASVTNLLPYSQLIGGTSWSGYCGTNASNMTLNTSVVTAPDGTNTATSFVEPGSFTCGQSGSWGAVATIGGGLIAGQTYTASVWLRGANGGESVAFGLNDCTWADVTLSTSWQRYSFTYPAITSDKANCVTGVRGFQVGDNSDPNITFYVWGAQVEAAASEGPYIKTNASAQSGLGGIASFNTSSLALGTHSITAAYGGDSNDISSTSSVLSQAVSLLTPTLSVATTGTPSIYGGSVTFTATISSGLTGTVTFYDNGSAIGSSTLSGSAATLTTSTLTAGNHSITASWAGNTEYAAVTSSAITQTVNQVTPAIAWATPAAITYGTALSGAQLDAGSITVQGTFAYSPGAGTVLAAGSSTLSATFTPTDTTDYSTASVSATITVNKATPTITWATPMNITPGTALSATQLNAKANLPGVFVYSPAIGAVPPEGTQTLSVTFTPTDAADYNTVTATVTQVVSYMPNAGIINTVAGDGITGYSGDGGPAINAEMNFPTGVAVDAAGNIYYSDGPHVRKVTASTGIITTVAGDGVFGYTGDNVPATSTAVLPFYIALDAAGNIYIGETDYRVRKVTVSTGIITTVAGNGALGISSDGGQATDTPLEGVAGLAVDAAGNIYIAEGDYDVRKVTASTGIITTVAGTANVQGFSGDYGAATSATLSSLEDLAVDTAGNLYIADTFNQRIRKVTASTGIITTVAGNGIQAYGGEGGPATSTSLNLPYGLAVDAEGNIYIADTYNQRVEKVRAVDGTITTVAGDGTQGFSGDGGPATSAELNGPISVAVDTSGNIYIPDNFYQRIRVVGGTKTTPPIIWATPVAVPYGTVLSSTQLNASSAVAGTFTYAPALGTILPVGPQTLTVTLTPTDAGYATTTATVTLTVSKATPAITWATPAGIPSGTALGATQLNASSSVAGTYTYAPALGTILSAGSHALLVTLTPADATDYTAATATVYINVTQVGGGTWDTGTVTLEVNGTPAATTTYGQGSTPSSIAEGLAANVSANSPVNVTAVDDAVSLQARATGSASNYSYSIETTSYDNRDFSQPSFLDPGVSGSLQGGADQNATGSAVYSYTVPTPSGGYDGVGNLLNYTDSVMGTWNFSDGYDSLNRLSLGTQTPVSGSAQSYCWSYDSFGNRTAQSASNQPFANTAGASGCEVAGSAALLANTWANYNGNNQITGTNQATGGYGYDPSGNVINDGVNQYLYDGDGRICAMYSAPLPGVTVMTGYIYNADGERVAKGSITTWSCDPTANGFQTTNDYVLGQSGEQVTEMGMDANGSMAWQHTNVFVGGSLIATYDQDGLHFYLDDPLGTRRSQTDYAGVLEQTCSSTPFGDNLACTGSTQYPTEHHFTGKERDTESGNDYFGARYYASTMGRFMSPDYSDDPDTVPYANFLNPQSLNLYAYLEGNPFSGVDPDGHGCGSWSYVGSYNGQVIQQSSGSDTSDCLSQVGSFLSSATQAVSHAVQQTVSATQNWAGAPRDQGCMNSYTLAGTLGGVADGAGFGTALGAGAGAVLAAPTGELAAPLTVPGGAALLGAGGSVLGGMIGGGAGHLAGWALCSTGSGGGSGGGGGGGKQGKFWKGLKSFRKDIKTNGLGGSAKRLFQWDYTHGDVEVYNGRGQHLGSADPETGAMTKPAVPGRTLSL